MRGEVAEVFSSQFRFADPSLVVTAQCGVIRQQGRPFTHGFEIYFERATLTYDFSVIRDVPTLSTPLTVFEHTGRVRRPKLGSGDPLDTFAAELGEMATSLRRAAESPILSASLASEAVNLCHKQTRSVQTGRSVRV